MRRLPRILLLLFTGPALLATAALLYLWPRSYGVKDVLSYPQEHGETNLQSTHGRLVFVRSRTRDADRHAPPPALFWKRDEPYDPDSFRRDLLARQHPTRTWAGITWHSAPQDPPAPQPASFSQLVVRHMALQVLIVPTWMALIPASLPLLPWLPRIRRRLQRRRRARRGQCLTCGYDLRGTPRGCPECGTTLPAANSPA